MGLQKCFKNPYQQNYISFMVNKNHENILGGKNSEIWDEIKEVIEKDLNVDVIHKNEYITKNNLIKLKLKLISVMKDHQKSKRHVQDIHKCLLILSTKMMKAIILKPF